MKRHLRHQARFEAGPNMTPLVDVVMVILIFLMLVGTFASNEWFLEQKAGMTQTATKCVAAAAKGFCSRRADRDPRDLSQRRSVHRASRQTYDERQGRT